MYLQENPAARLYDILSEASNLARSAQNVKFKKTWSIVFNVDENDYDGILQGISGVHYLYNQTRKLISESDKLNDQRNLSFLDNIYSAIYILNLQGEISAFNQRLTKETLTALSYMRDSISMVYELDNTLLTTDEQEDLIDQINELLNDFINSDLPEDLISISTDSLANIKSALVHYKIYGSKGLEEATSRAIGNLYLKSASKINNDNNEMNKFFKIVERVRMLLNTSESLVKLASMSDPILSLLIKK
ncbi:hypothetical protein [Virgibacillus halodenitrificans]|uniref:DUF403 domain-containing protein n=1 Tax=Virgibacillus halodenitrificans TaxID=1482 RepID=A0ABR7VN94_VIRHA|nr:hypothetical protein [Virgibacillus halodenitrificans]MBD1222771.1 hypothetical protein [Virgibacillus halodenitrificans]